MKIQWLGHSAFKITGTQASVLIDPFLTGNPRYVGTPAEAATGVDHVLLTHAHGDHFGDTLALLDLTGATLVAMVEIANYVRSLRPGARTVGMNFGGTYASPQGLTVSLVPAWHSSVYTDARGQTINGGLPAGIVLGLDGHRLYHMGDTAIFSDMALIEEIHKPDIGIVPIGGHYTMDAKTAALAVNRYFSFATVIPCHYMTFPVLAQSADAFVAGVESAKVVTPRPMETVEI